MTEAAIQRAILLALGALPGVQVWRTPAVCCYLPDGRGGYRPVWPLPPGWPDLTCIAYGCALAIEVKAPSMRRRDGTARLRPSQQAMRVVWEAAGGVWVIATDVAEAVAAVRALRGAE